MIFKEKQPHKTTEAPEDFNLTPDQDIFNQVEQKIDKIEQEPSITSGALNPSDEQEYQQVSIVLPSRCLFYPKGFPTQVIIRDLSVGEAQKLRAIVLKMNNQLNNIKSEILLGLQNMIPIEKKFTKEETEFLNNVTRSLEPQEVRFSYQNEELNDCYYLDPDFINVFQNCVITDINLRDLTVDDFNFVAWNIIFLSKPVVSYSYYFERYGIKGDINVTINDIIQNVVENSNVKIINKFSHLINHWKSRGFTPPLVKYLEIKRANIYRKDITEEQNEKQGNWSEEVTLLYSLGGQYIKANSVQEQLKRIQGSYFKKAKFIKELSIFVRFYKKYLKIKQVIKKQATLSSYNYGTLQNVIKGLQEYKEQHPDAKETEEIDEEIQEIQKLIETNKANKTPFKTPDNIGKAISVNLDIALPQLVQLF